MDTIIIKNSGRKKDYRKLFPLLLSKMRRKQGGLHYIAALLIRILFAAGIFLFLIFTVGIALEIEATPNFFFQNTHSLSCVCRYISIILITFFLPVFYMIVESFYSFHKFWKVWKKIEVSSDIRIHSVLFEPTGLSVCAEKISSGERKMFPCPYVSLTGIWIKRRGILFFHPDFGETAAPVLLPERCFSKTQYCQVKTWIRAARKKHREVSAKS